MADASASGASQPKILEQLVEAGKGAFDPSITDQPAKNSSLRRYNELIQSTETTILLPALNTLIKPNVLPEWLRLPLMQSLTFIPLRPDGVRGTMEFVFSVHPTSASRSGDVPTLQKQGASITHEAVAVATRLLSSVPASMTPQAWFDGIAGQLFHLIDGADGPDLARTAAQIVGFGILGKRQFGAPGAPGWVAFVQPLLAGLNPSLEAGSKPRKVEEDEIIDVRLRKVLVQSPLLDRSLQRLRMLVLSNPSSGLCRRTTTPVFLQIWVLASLSSSEESVAQVKMAARDLLQTCFRLFGTGDITSTIIPNLLSKGPSPGTDLAWEYHSAQQGGVEVVASPDPVLSQNNEMDWSQVQEKAATLVELMTSACSTEDLTSLFLGLFQSWIKTSQESENNSGIITVVPLRTPHSPLSELVEVTILQQLLETVPEKLVGQFDQLQDLISHVFRMDAQSRLADEPVAIILSLLNLIVTAPTFNKSDLKKENLEIVEQSLDRLSRDGSRSQISQTASNIALLLKYRSEESQDDEPVSGPSSRQLEDRRVYSLAMNYVTGADNPPPVVSEGLNLLSGLIASRSSILDVTAVNVLLSNLLSNNEDYINLRVVKMFTQLAENHPKSTVRELVDHYLDPQEKANTDTRLRFGEALVQVIERLGQTFTAETATHACETLLSIAGRRGYRPKTMAKQRRDEKLKKRKSNNDDGENDVDMDGGDDDERTEEERARDEILAQIVQGWDSKRGSEDVRMRASALSIFGTALETNTAGIGATMVSNSIDLCINILTLEPEMEKSVVRRAAILVVLGFVRALEEARNGGRSLGFGLTDQSREDIQRTLQYIASTDNDGLVQQHAKDVFESLEAWQMATLLPQPEQTDRTGLGGLAGLAINPLENLGSRPREDARPRIEEIE